MKANNYLKTICLFTTLLACQTSTPNPIATESSYDLTKDTKHFKERLKKHLNAVSKQDLATLRSAL